MKTTVWVLIATALLSFSVLLCLWGINEIEEFATETETLNLFLMSNDWNVQVCDAREAK